MTVKAGDIVQLKSGGPYMTVGEIKHSYAFDLEYGNDVAVCFWFDDFLQAHHAEFIPNTLSSVVIPTFRSE